MHAIMTVINEATRTSFMADSEKTILENLREKGFSSPDAPCGGNGHCLKCSAVISGTLIATGSREVYTAIAENLLCCRWKPAGNCTVKLSDYGEMNILTGAQQLSGSEDSGLGVAVDIGTTTVAVSLYDLGTGEALAASGQRNAQRPFGADVISRISCCENGHEPELTAAIRTQITAMIKHLCECTSKNSTEIVRVAIAGNTVMEHIFCGLDPSSIGKAPFIPKSLFGNTIPASGTLDSVSPTCEIYLTPALAGYVGGDVMAGITIMKAEMTSGNWLYLDIGTNGEMGMGNADGFLCCAAAAGPAFEGAEIECGMPGTAGAIDRVSIVNGDIALHVLGDAEVLGICGSGLIDATACLLELGAIDETGRLDIPEDATETLKKHFSTREDGNMCFFFTPQIYLSAADIRQLQLAKAAIRAGVETLLSSQGLTARQLDGILVAGGFGNFLNIQSAIRIGLLPDIPEKKIKLVGNSAEAGAALALHDHGIQEIETMKAHCRYLELSTSKDFTEQYLDQLMFEPSF